MKKRSLAFLAAGLLGMFGLASSCESGTATESCSDGIKNGTESDVDCGGSCSSACAVGKGCSVATDCADGTCTAGVCVAPSCTDGVKNGTEAGVDCGGSCPTQCANGSCKTGADCQSGVCVANACAAPSCTDKAKNGSETDVDCGGGTCPACAPRNDCMVNSDCTSLLCNGGFCAYPVCYDKIKNGAESDIDCGGNVCGGCNDGQACNVGTDCKSVVCTANVCTPSQCNDSVKNGTETDVDCGGPTCLKCADKLACSGASDCMSGICTANKCAVPTCTDGVLNGAETDLDCGGPTCPACGNSKACVVPTDCMSMVCTGNFCIAPGCSDGVKNATETDVDCGGASCAPCAVMKACMVDKDCLSNVCYNNVCLPTPTLTSVTPNMGRTTATTAVTLNGTNFFTVGAAAMSVMFGANAGTAPQITTATTATTTAPMAANTPGLVPVTMTLLGNHVVTLANAFRYYYGTLAINAATTTNNAISYDGVVIADFDAKNGNDIAAAHVNGMGGVDIFLNRASNATFNPSVTLPTAPGTNRVVAADFNGDGKMDLAASHTTGQVAVLLGNGTGGFAAAKMYALPGTLAGLVAADVDQKTGVDLLVSNSTVGQVSLLKNDGTGTFTATAGFIPGLVAPTGLASGDFNGDKFPDVVVVSQTAATAQVCLNQAGASYLCTSSAAPGTNGAVVVGDIGTDGFADYVLTSPNSTTVMAYTGKGNGTFNAATSSTNVATAAWKHMQLVDIDLDTYADLVFVNGGNNVGVCKGNGSGTFTAASVTRNVGVTPNYVAVGQLNTATDQKLDFAVGTVAGLAVMTANHN